MEQRLWLVGIVLSLAAVSLTCGSDDPATPDEPNVPTVTTAAVDAIAETSADCGGNVVADGGEPVTARGVCWSSDPGPTIADDVTSDGTGTGAFTSQITGLDPGTPYFVRAYATNSVGTGYGSERTFETASPPNIVTDIDGNLYHMVTIGKQTWLVENLRVTRYCNGDSIPAVTDGGSWGGLTSGAYCNYGNSDANVEAYGRLYNWWAVNDGRYLAPVGWHVPSDAEWQTLCDSLGGSSIAGGALKEAGTAHWSDPNTGATNASGFTGLPGGFRSAYGPFYALRTEGRFWSATPQDAANSWGRELQSTNAQFSLIIGYNADGLSVRCIKD